jgi:dTMP kinase
MSALFVAIDGGDGCGKTTQAQLLHARLLAANISAVLTRQPGGTNAGKVIRELLLDPVSRLDPRTEALLYAADRAQHVAEVVRPALEAGTVVVQDRGVDSSLAYQAAGRGMDREVVANLSRWATEGLTPDLTIVLDIDPEVGLARATRDGVLDRLEREDLAFHERVRAGFLDCVARAPERYLLLDATRAVEELEEAIWSRVQDLLTVGVSA